LLLLSRCGTGGGGGSSIEKSLPVPKKISLNRLIYKYQKKYQTKKIPISFPKTILVFLGFGIFLKISLIRLIFFGLPKRLDLMMNISNSEIFQMLRAS
jgi:hypothetical protein